MTLYLASAGKRLLARGHSLSARGTIKLRRAAGGYTVSQAAVGDAASVPPETHLRAPSTFNLYRTGALKQAPPRAA